MRAEIVGTHNTGDLEHHTEETKAFITAAEMIYAKVAFVHKLNSVRNYPKPRNHHLVIEVSSENQVTR